MSAIRILVVPALAVLLAAAPAAAQPGCPPPNWLKVDVVCGPNPAPIGCNICATISNDTSCLVYNASQCPFVIKDSTGQVIYTGANFCTVGPPQPMSPGQSLTMVWGQISELTGTPVPPGNYTFEVTMPFYFGGGSPPQQIPVAAPVPFQITISTLTNAAVSPLGVHRIGTARELMFCAPNDVGKPFVMMASTIFNPGSAQPCPGVVIPLTFDDLLFYSLFPNPFFLNFQGTIGLDGQNTLPAPTLNIPPVPSLGGVSILLAGVIIEPANPACPVGTISGPYQVTFLP